MRALIFHGTMGSPGRNWFPWLKSELEARNIPTLVPALPTPDGQTLENWLAQTQAQCGPIDADTILIGHSCGALFTLRLLEQMGQVIVPYVALVGTVIAYIGRERVDTLNQSFIAGVYDWPAIKKHAAHISLFHGDNDPYVPLSHPQEIAEKLSVPLTVIPGGGHLNQESGYTSFPLLLDDIVSVTNRHAV